ncbi:MAG: helix-turn-helix domain-containing protein [Prosthecobacter sp.]|nr:helix-turn-helix domain-containing protein [Prosthecobacter sp.]
MSHPAQIDPVERAIVLILKRERLKAKISATSLAAQIGVSRTTITHLESDDARPTFWVLKKIADGLGLDFGQCVVEAQKEAKE